MKALEVDGIEWERVSRRHWEAQPDARTQLWAMRTLGGLWVAQVERRTDRVISAARFSYDTRDNVLAAATRYYHRVYAPRARRQRLVQAVQDATRALEEFDKEAR